jgi:hypothetical protein
MAKTKEKDITRGGYFKDSGTPKSAGGVKRACEGV